MGSSISPIFKKTPRGKSGIAKNGGSYQDFVGGEQSHKGL